VDRADSIGVVVVVGRLVVGIGRWWFLGRRRFVRRRRFVGELVR
jgi:hypothetical protein